MSSLRAIFLWLFAGFYFGFLLIRILLLSGFRSAEALDPYIKKRLLRLFHLLGSRITVEFEEPLREDTAYIFMANHSSLIDIPFLQACVPRHFIGILAKHQFKFFLYGKTVEKLGHLAIDRSNPRKSLKVFKQAQHLLKQGTSIVVLPEGGRSMDGHLIPFKKLPFRFALEAGHGIVPVSISGAFQMKPKGSWKLSPGNLVMRFGAIIAVKDFLPGRLDELREKVYAQIYEGLEEFEQGE